MSSKLLFPFLCFCSGAFYSQYKPIDTADFSQRKDFLKSYKTENDIFVKDLKSKYSGKTSSELGKFYNEIYKDFEKEVKNKDYLFNSPFDESLNEMLAKIQKANPQVSGKLKVLVAKNNTPNAFCLADGTFIINMGLFNWMENEDQVAGVLCHEIAHKLKEHSLQQIISYISESEKDKETVKNIKAQTLNKTDKAFDIVKNRLYKKQDGKRKNETQADSLGYALFRNSGFKKEEFKNALKNLRDFDTISPREIKLETYKKIYDLPNQPFNEKWMKKEDFSIYNYDLYKDKLNVDSLSTHPELVKRIATLEKEFPELLKDEPVTEAGEDFKKLRTTAKMEIFPNFYHSEDFGVGIYVAMQMIQDNFQEEYVKSWIGKFFGKIYEARKNYNLNRYLDRIEPKDQSESYQQFLNFMWNLKLEEIKNISDFYNKKES